MNAKWKMSHLKGSNARCYICDRCGYVVCGESTQTDTCPSCKSLMVNYIESKEGENNAK